MRTFLIKASLFILLIIICILSVITFKIVITDSLSFKLPSNVTYIFTGASHPYRGIDGSLTRNAVNLSAPSERYMFTYLKLKKFLNANPQVDTVFIECAPTDLWQNSDDKYFANNEMSRFIPTYFPLFTSSEWAQYHNDMRKVITMVIQKSFDPSQLTKHSLQRLIGSQANKIENSERLDTTLVERHLMEGCRGNNINLLYLRKIINLCKNKNVQLYGIYFPMYHPEYFYDQEYYYKVLSELYTDLELLDYHNLNLPDSAFFDAHHLNNIGAFMFTSLIKKRFSMK